MLAKTINLIYAKTIIVYSLTRGQSAHVARMAHNAHAAHTAYMAPTTAKKIFFFFKLPNLK